MSNLELKIHPPIILLISGVLAWIVAEISPGASISTSGIQTGLCLLFVSGGLLLALAAVFGFHRVKTTIHPTHPNETSTLVTGGVYRHSRNPMYLGLLLILFGWMVMLGNLFSLIALVFFVWYLTRFQIRPEERILASKFGSEYAAYCSQVRRWI
ncbi:MAG: isoprenylcysteine carboxylmethyltransferase family protein [Pseudomonadota bacterium]